MVKEIPILFSTAMVDALIEGRKTMTRRMDKLEEINQHPDDWIVSEPVICHPEGLKFEFTNKHTAVTICITPKWQPAAFLWVRETLLQNGELGLSYVSGGEWIDESIIPHAYGPYGGDYLFRNIPSIHMPKWASRIWPKITNVRVERLDAISENDAIAEGIAMHMPVPGDGVPVYKNYSLAGAVWHSAVNSFCTLWESINGKGSWDANPWV